MNRAYKLVWNTVSNSWVVASELAKGAKKSSGKTLKLAVFMAAGFSGGVALAAPAINALPTGESVASGSAIFDRTVTNQLTVNQSSSKLITNWNSFDVGSSGKVVFVQPDAASIALNRVTSGSATEIFGQVTANGQLVIVNPNGITFGAGSQVSAASIIGSVLDIQDSDVNAGTLLFSRGAATGSIDNKGSLTATAGSVSLLGATIKNTGTVSASGGNAALINADAVNLTTAVPSISTASSITGLIQQSGSITATQVSSVGGKILLTGDTSQAASQIQLAGTLDATTNTNVNGRSIVVNGDVNLNGTTNSLDLTSTSGYSLTNAAQLNLNGASSAFSVNGTGYTVIRDVNQLQAMSSNLTGKYVLAANIDASATASWNSGAGFAPVGNFITKFSGVLDGLGHVVNGLTINQPSNNYIGLIGSTHNSLIQNIGVSGSVSGNYYVGGLVGFNQNSTVTNSYVSGSVSGTGSYVGGLVGANQNSTVTNSYTNGSVTGIGSVGGLVGENENSTITNSYAIGDVSGPGDLYTGGLVGANIYGSTITNSYASGSVEGEIVGGLVGYNFSYSSITNSYASGSVEGGSRSGGLVGYNSSFSSITNSYASGKVWLHYTGIGGLVGFNDDAAVINDSYWDIDSTGQHYSVGGGDSPGNNLIGLSSSQMKSLSSFANWGSTIDAQGGTGSVWRIYEGQSQPLLRSFLKPLYMTVNNTDSKIYDGSTYVTTVALDYLINSTGYDSSNVLGTAVLAGTALGARNAGSHTFDVGGLYSTQNGYDFVVNKGALTINRASLSIGTTDVNKTYDGTTAVDGTAVVTGGEVFDTDSISGGTFTFNNKNAGSNKTVTVSGVTVNDGNGGNNYNVTYDVNTGSYIDPALLTISSTAVTKTYDGTTSAKGTAILAGATQLHGTDSISGGTFVFDDKNAGSGKSVIVSGVTVNDGNNGDNYLVSYESNTDSSISKRLLTISAVADSKEYDAKLTSSATGKPVVVGRQRGDAIVGLTQSYLDKNAGSGKTINVDGGFTIRDGNNGNNYDVVIVNSNAGVITPKALTISTVANSKVYDGGVTSANKPVVTGLAYGDRVTGLFQQYETKTIGTGKKLIVKSGYVVQDGNGGGNYSVVQQTSNDGVITAH